MGRNNSQNIKKHNDKLHKEQDKAKAKKTIRAEKLKEIARKFNQNKTAWFLVIAEAYNPFLAVANLLSLAQNKPQLPKP